MSAERQTAKTGTRSSFGSIQVLIMMALFIALSIVLGKQLSFTAGPFRISFENLTVLMAGIFFGPLAGLTVGACADLYNPKTVRATMGALFRRPVWRCAPAQAKALLSAAGIPLWGAALRCDTVDARQVDYTRAAVAIGSEGRGLSEEVLALCDQTIRLPMSERCESLNAAVAAAVLLWEMYR